MRKKRQRDGYLDYYCSLLDDLGDQVDRSEGKLKNAMRRVTTILRKEEGIITLYIKMKPHVLKKKPYII